jgi:hypothetical protein
MSERIDKLEYQDADEVQSTIDEGVRTKLFHDGPGEFLAREVVKAMGADPVWKTLFGDSMDSYQRMDYGDRAFPAIRIYDRGYRKEYDSWFINGELYVDVIWPPSIRRRETQQLPDTVSSALLQQFRRPSFFTAMCGVVPGLNELGKNFNVDKSLGFEWKDGVIPLTQITVNFRVDLREWDRYLEKTDRTKDTPFEESIGDLRRLVSEIQGLDDSEEVNVTVPIDQKMT